MPFAAPDNFSFRPYTFPPMTGGLTFTQATDSDVLVLDNAEILRDKFVRARRGANISHTAGALGSGKILGLDVCVAGNSGYLIIAKQGTTFYAVPASTISGSGTFTGAITPFTVPTAPTPSGDFWAVRMATVTYTNSTPCVYMCHPSWNKIVKWTGAGAATEVAASPQATDIVFHSDNRVWALTNNRTHLKWSDPGTPESWPTTNDIALSSAYGQVSALLSFPDRILLFCARGILSVTGDPDADNLRINVEHPTIGLNNPYTLSNFGNTAMFCYEGNAYQFSGTVSLVSDAIRDKFGIDGSGAAALGEYGYLIRVPAVTAPSGTSSYFFDRVRYGFWSQWKYPVSAGLGAANPYPSIKYFKNNYYLAGGDGNVYAQACWGQSLQESDTPYSQRLPQIPDAPGTAVSVSVMTRAVDFGDDLLTKAWRAVQVYGFGENVNITLTLYDSAGVSHNITLATGATLPCEINTPAVDGTSASPYTEFNEAQLTITGDYLLLKKIIIWWRPVRFGQISYANS